MNMFLHEIKAYRKSTIIWTVTLIAITVLFMLMFPAIYREGQAFKKLLEGFPKNVGAALGMTVEFITSFIGFYCFSFMYVILCGSIQAMILGTSIVSKEIREKTADFLLTKPVSRIKIITSKLLAIFCSLIFTNVLFLASVNILAPIMSPEPFDGKVLFLVSLTLFFVQLMFMALGSLISVIARKIKSVLAISLGTVFGFFVLSMFGSIIGDTTVRYLTPFKYFDVEYIIRNSAYETSYVIVGAAFVVVATVLSYCIYIKKDIHAV